MIMIITSFVVLLNCLYINLSVLDFVHSPLHPTMSGEQVSCCVILVAGCQVKPREIF